MKWAIRLTNGREDRGLLVVRHGVAAVYAERRNAETEAKWLSATAKRNGSATVYETTPWKEAAGMAMELQDQLQRKSSGSRKTSSEDTSGGGRTSNADTPESSEAAPEPPTPSLSGLFDGSVATDGTA